MWIAVCIRLNLEYLCSSLFPRVKSLYTRGLRLVAKAVRKAQERSDFHLT